MKNIYVLPTDKPSRLFINTLWENKLRFLKEHLIEKNKEKLPKNIYITSDEPIKDEDWCFDLDYIEPIPLTEYILLKCGFEKDVQFKIKFNNLRFNLFQINASNNYNNNFNEFTVTVYQSKQSVEICRLRYLHQLQNLIHSLTNTELEIQL